NRERHVPVSGPAPRDPTRPDPTRCGPATSRSFHPENREERLSMKCITAIAVVVLAAAPLATPGQSADRVESTRKTQDNTTPGQIRQLEERLREAALKGDVSFFEEYWADGYLRTNSFGILLTREEALSN